MADIDATITNNTNSKQFKFRAVHNWKFGKNQPVMSIPFIDTTPENTILFRFFGQQEKVSFSFVLFDDGTDVSNGDSITTVNQQIDYLRNNIFTDEYDTTWSFSDNRYFTTAVTVVITDLQIESRAGAPSFAIGTITLQRGRIATL
jgi:hypothetical protein